MKKSEIKYGDIIWTDFDFSVGHEFREKRPAIVIQSKEILSRSNLATVIPLTSNINNKIADDIVVTPNKGNGLISASVIKVYNIVSCDYSRLLKLIGVADRETLIEIKKYLKKHFDL